MRDPAKGRLFTIEAPRAPSSINGGCLSGVRLCTLASGPALQIRGQPFITSPLLCERTTSDRFRREPHPLENASKPERRQSP
jgi:hypothetical protein